MPFKKLNVDVASSRLAVSRRRALGLGGSIGLGALLTACSTTEPGASTTAATSTGAATLTPSTAAAGDIVAKLDAVGSSCGTETEDVTSGPYYFDVDSIRSDLREDRPGTQLDIAFRVWDANCTPLPNSVVEIWHCDAGGVYSGFESASTGGGGGGRVGGGGGTTDGSYTEGDSEATPGDDGTYLRGAQVADANGIVQFTTVWPGWYRGRTVHVHLKVHVNKATVLTAQVGFDDDLNTIVFDTSPYDEHTGRDTFNGGSAGSGTDNIISSSAQLLTVETTATGYLGYINLDVGQV
ncbi:hypothetical protein [Cryobacterium sp. PH31-L1]|uniref:dioxygenase family protein n=1 Tax=Cryobacterium sp. PH31-L1 TaxID=3046199 RepID=UPI0024B8806E|nr:hypothetical protein [Cryobacterium sp. PH31-L1]MDJ0377109.1 hypothetical protein [Cryobacterium sp. PH31-L1]